jgi:hemoglobin
MDTKTQTLYARLGGEQAIARLVEQFYDRVLDDPELEPFFRATPMEKLRSMQLEFFAAALDGPIGYSGQPIHYVHQGRGITSRHLTRFLGHLVATIQDAHPNEREVQEMIDRISMYADSVIDGAAGDSE